MTRHAIIRLIPAILVFATALSGCSRRPGRAKIIFVGKTLQCDYHQRVAQGAIQAAQANGIDLDVFAPQAEDNFLEQRARIRSLIQDGYRALILAPNDSNALKEDIGLLEEHGIPYIIVDTPLEFQGNEKLKHYCATASKVGWI